MKWARHVPLLAPGMLLAGFTVRVPGQTPERQDSAAQQVALGRQLFEGKGLCFSCHGKNGEGVLAPSTRLAGRVLVHTKATVDDEVAAVVWYVLELQRQKSPP